MTPACFGIGGSEFSTKQILCIIHVCVALDVSPCARPMLSRHSGLGYFGGRKAIKN